ncbi:MAG TPA: choice-of-anchor tandem repeat GloVer-containing protein, partial [Tepidisphaeraceae bacterium]
MESRTLLSGYTLSQFGTTDGSANGANPQSMLTADRFGNLWGTTSAGGANGDGTVFEIAKGSRKLTTVASFNGTNGAAPISNVVSDSNNDVFGTTTGGGGFGDGTLWEIANGTKTITTLVYFNGSNGANPRGALIIDSLNVIWGTTSGGGADGDGTVFRIPHGGSLTTIASFNGINGKSPTGGLTMDGSSNLYGTAELGGANGIGTVFKIASGSTVVTTLASFNGANGQYPEAAPTLDTSGNLYGTTYLGGPGGNGTIYEVAKGLNAITSLAAFNVANGENPQGGLWLDSSGNLYGTTVQGGANGDGTIFEMPVGPNTIGVLASFSGPDGSEPTAGVWLDSYGNLYGTTSVGGPSAAGTVYELTATPTVSLWLASKFNARVDGSSSDNYSESLKFQLSISGGVPDGETIALEDASNHNAVVASGSISAGSLTLVVPGQALATGTHNLIAVYVGDGVYGPSQSPVFAETILEPYVESATGYFGANDDGVNPRSGLAADSNGNLYGTAYVGGDFGLGTVFEIAKGSTAMTNLASFNGANGAYPSTAVTVDPSGNLYGTTSSYGPSGSGGVFEIAAGSNA